ncbi:MAG: hypothetical protein WCO11_02560 [Sphingomonadales bacterium]|jgi:catechol 2,3-dioxygenase-like lactoylglutathione lyase family enzyme
MTNVVMAMVCVADRARARAFYETVLGPVLGLRLSESDDFGDQFAGEAGIVRLTAIPGWQPGSHPVLGWQVADAAATVAALGARGVTMNIYDGMGQDASALWTAPDGKTRLAWFADSEGNLLSIAQQA